MLNGAKQKRHRQPILRQHEIPDQRDAGPRTIDGPGAGLLAALRDRAVREAQRPDGRILLALGSSRAKYARDRARRDRRQKQRANECYGPPKAGAAVHRQLHSLMMMSTAGKKGSIQLWQKKERLAEA